MTDRPKRTAPSRADGRLQIAHVDPKTLTPSENRVRRHPKIKIKKLAQSIKDHGLNIPLRVNGAGIVLGGHALLESVLLLGLPEVPIVRITHLSAAEERLYAIAENKLAEGSVWEFEKLAHEFEAISKLEPEIELRRSAFETPERDIIFNRIQTDRLADLDEEVPAIYDRPPVSRRGDLFQTDDGRVYCGDAMESSSIAFACGDREVRAVISDLPFNVKIGGHVSGLGKHKHREFAAASGELSKPQFSDFIARGIAATKPKLIPGALLYLFMDWRHMSELLTAAEQEQLDQLNLLVWAKTNAGMGSHYRSAHELIGLFKHGDTPHINNVQLGVHGRYRTNVLQYPGMNSFGRGRGKALELHPTVKPTALIADLILDCSAPGELILDSFGGSGTTLIAAAKTDRAAALVEIDPAYVDTTIRRWQDLTGKQARLVSTGQTFAELAAARADENRDAA